MDYSAECLCETFSVHQLDDRYEGHRKYRQYLKDADIVMAREVLGAGEGDSPLGLLVYGRELIEDIAAGRGSEFERKKMVVLEYGETKPATQIEDVCFVVQRLKGKCEYPSEADE